MGSDASPVEISIRGFLCCHQKGLIVRVEKLWSLAALLVRMQDAADLLDHPSQDWLTEQCSIQRQWPLNTGM
jgi:hypothetical protein